MIIRNEKTHRGILVYGRPRSTGVGSPIAFDVLYRAPKPEGFKTNDFGVFWSNLKRETEIGILMPFPRPGFADGFYEEGQSIHVKTESGARFIGYEDG
jgi:hypothetical protein